jgi:hypothetical protein
MAKELPYFKFFVSEWSDGDITLEDFNTQGLFINLCSYYWSNECELTLTKAKKKFKICDKSCFDSIIEAGIIKVDDDVITINFLDEQQEERIEQSKTRSKGGKASAEARKRKKEQESNKNPTHVQHVLKSCSTETQLLREEKKREEKKKEEVNPFKKWDKNQFKEEINKNAQGMEGMTVKIMKTFFEYWTELDSKGKMKFQLQTTWNTKGRLARFLK